jgi:hypothetical protein
MSVSAKINCAVCLQSTCHFSAYCCSHSVVGYVEICGTIPGMKENYGGWNLHSSRVLKLQRISVSQSLIFVSSAFFQVIYIYKFIFRAKHLRQLNGRHSKSMYVSLEEQESMECINDFILKSDIS